MIVEALLYATALADRDCRRLGLVGDAVALWSRATRCRTAWEPHQARCEAAVRRAILRVPRGGTALVLGSGLARDIALPALAAHFDDVLLVDAVHLLPSRVRARRVGAEPITTDLTGCVAWLLGRADGRHDPLASFRKQPIRFVLSANCLSQLPMSVGRFAERHREAATRLPDELARRIVDWHLADLLSFGVPACLLTDTHYRRLTRDGSVLDETDLLAGSALPPPDESWDWEIAPPGERERHTSTVHRVHVYEDLADAMTADAAAGVGYTRPATFLDS